MNLFTALHRLVLVGQTTFSLAVMSSTSCPASERVISVDVNAIKGPTNRNYQTIGAGRVGEGRYAAWQQQLKLCRDELGIDALRAHGLFQDELGVYREDAKGNVSYNFQYVDLVYDFLVSIGIHSFVEFGFMPNDLATIRADEADRGGFQGDSNEPQKRRRITIFEWRGNITPPKDLKKWGDLVSAITQHWTARYGTEEVKKWRFEIWNEPNLPDFWSPNNEKNRQQEYFDLYAVTAKAVKNVDSLYRVGGPATAGPKWTNELIAFCSQNNAPIDFISYHTYGLAGGAGGLDEFGEKLLYLNLDTHSVADAANSQLAVIEKSAKPGLPINVTEWSASYSSRDPVHDDYFSAPFILEQLRNTQRIASMSYWTFTDIFEEGGAPPRPFHGGFGLLTVNGIKKPAYFAYRFLHRLGDEELVNSDSRSWVCRDKTGGVQALFWDMTMPEMNGQANQKVFRQVRVANPSQTVTLSLAGLKPGRYQLSVYGVGFEKNDAYTAYLKIGAPNALTPEQAQFLKAKTTDSPEQTEEIVVPESGKWERQFSLRANDIVLTDLKPT